MINKLPGSIMHSNILNAGNGSSSNMTTKFLKSKTVGKICETAAKSPVVCQSVFSLLICCLARPATNMITTKDKKDASYASCHSISSGLMGFAWSMVISTPIALAMGAILKKPQGFLNKNLIKKLYPAVGIKKSVNKAGKTVEELMVDSNKNLLRQNGTLLSRSIEPLKVEAEKAPEFIKNHPNLTVDKHGVVRSTDTFQTKDGKFIMKDGHKVGCAVQKADMTPITEEVELGIKKEQNMSTLMNWIPDIVLAPPRAMLTVALIPWFLKNVFGIEKAKKTDNKAAAATAAATNNTQPAAKANTVAVASAAQPTATQPASQIKLINIQPAQQAVSAKGGV